MNLRARAFRIAFPLAAAALLAACATGSDPSPAPRKEIAYAIQPTGVMTFELIKFNTGEPQRILDRKPIKGLPGGDSLLGMDFRVARGVLYTISHVGRLYTLDTATGELQPVAMTPPPYEGPLIAAERVMGGYRLQGTSYGFDFNPAADRIRLVSDAGLNIRINPDTGVTVDSDPNTPGTQGDGPLAYVAGDVNAGKKPTLVAAGYTYNKKDEKLTTNYAIDRDLGVLVMQGSKEGETPVVSPNTGQLRTVGPLGIGTVRDASFDIADVSNAAFLAARTAEDTRTRLYLVDLQTGKARPLGTIGNGNPVIGLAIEP
jgi:hypothetical protein